MRIHIDSIETIDMERNEFGTSLAYLIARQRGTVWYKI